MTLDELWELFPIFLTPHNPQWEIWAEEEMRLLSDILSSYDQSHRQYCHKSYSGKTDYGYSCGTFNRHYNQRSGEFYANSIFDNRCTQYFS